MGYSASRWIVGWSGLTLEDLENIGEFVGALGVVISLVYVAIQIRQNTRQITDNTNALKLSEESAAQQNFSRLRLLLIGDSEASQLFERGLAGDRSLDATELFRVRRNGKKLLRLTNNGPVIDVSPSWSPDGKRLALVSDRSGTPQIYIMDRDGGNQRRISYQSAYSATPAWSPDGRWIAYGVRTEAQFDLYLIDPTGEVTVPLVVHRGNDQYPSWSPDGRKVVFSSDRRGHDDLYVIDVNSQRLQRLTKGAKDNLAPAWGPFPE